MPQDDTTSVPVSRAVREAGDEQTIALRVIVGLLVIAAAWWMAYILVPFVLAVVLAVALSPLADRLERLGLPRAVSSLACTLAVVAAVALGVGLVLYQTSTLARDSGRYVQRFASLLDDLTRRTNSGRTLVWLGRARAEARRASTGANEPSATRVDRSASADDSQGRDVAEPTPDWNRFLDMALGTVGNWLVAGVGGLLGALGGGVLCFASLFYMLHGRDGWLESLTRAARRLGMNPRDDLLAEIREQVVTFLGYLALIASCYFVIVSLALWLIGVPQPLLWGLIAGLFEVVPYFGPLIASVLPTIVALSLGTWWQPLAVAGLFLTLHLVEGYFISPMVYGRAVKLDPVTILFGAVFFGWLWGPAGLAVSTPMLILLRGLLEITTDTPALDALADIDDAKTKNGVRQAARTS